MRHSILAPTQVIIICGSYDGVRRLAPTFLTEKRAGEIGSDRNERRSTFVPENPPKTVQHRPPILTQAEAERRFVLLSTLQSALSAHSLISVLVGNHRLVLHADCRPLAPSGPTDPQLHIFTPDGTDVAATDGSTYRLASGRQCPADDPAAATTLIRQGQPAAPRA